MEVFHRKLSKVLKVFRHEEVYIVIQWWSVANEEQAPSTSDGFVGEHIDYNDVYSG